MRREIHKMKKIILRTIVFVLITVVLFLYLFEVFLPALDNIGGYENENVVPTTTQSSQALMYIVPPILIYSIAVSMSYYFKIKVLNIIIFPMLVFTYYVLLICLGVAWSGSAFMWMMILTLVPAFFVFLVSFILGLRSDVKYKNNHA